MSVGVKECMIVWTGLWDKVQHRDANVGNCRSTSIVVWTWFMIDNHPQDSRVNVQQFLFSRHLSSFAGPYVDFELESFLALRYLFRSPSRKGSRCLCTKFVYFVYSHASSGKIKKYIKSLKLTTRCARNAPEGIWPEFVLELWDRRPSPTCLFHDWWHHSCLFIGQSIKYCSLSSSIPANCLHSRQNSN